METIKHIISGYDVLPEGVIKPSAILKIMQDAATTDASNLGADYLSLRSKDMIFVITKIIVEYNRLPHVDECLEVRTWNSGTSGVSFVRNYVFNVGDEVVGKATSRWVLVSYATRRILRPDALFTNVTTNEQEELDMEPSRRIRLSENALVLKNQYRASVTDMDTNYHVNNTRYGDLLVDYCGIDFEKKAIKEFEIHFVNELKAGESVEIEAVVEDNTGYMTAHKDGAQVFAARVLVSDKNGLIF